MYVRWMFNMLRLRAQWYSLAAISRVPIEPSKDSQRPKADMPVIPAPLCARLLNARVIKTPSLPFSLSFLFVCPLPPRLSVSNSDVRGTMVNSLYHEVLWRQGRMKGRFNKKPLRNDGRHFSLLNYCSLVECIKHSDNKWHASLWEITEIACININFCYYWNNE